MRPWCSSGSGGTIPEFDAVLREYLFKSGPIVGREAEVMGRNGHGSGAGPAPTVGSLREAR